MNVKRKKEYRRTRAVATNIERICEEFLPTKEEMEKMKHMKISEEEKLKMPNTNRKELSTDIAIWVDWTIRALERYYVCECGGKLVLTRKTGSSSKYSCVNCKKSWEYNYVTHKVNECKQLLGNIRVICIDV